MKLLSYVTDEPWAVCTASAIHVDWVCRSSAGHHKVQRYSHDSLSDQVETHYGEIVAACQGSGRSEGMGSAENLVTSL
jgi:hypothetical protein